MQGSAQTTKTERRIGLEQEFFLVSESGAPSDRADEFLARCRKEAPEEISESFVEECTKGMLEINTPPAPTLAALSTGYLTRLELALRVGREMSLRLYSLAAYPLEMIPPLRTDPSYEIQARAVGRERFLHAGRCIGTHLHLELPEGTIDPATFISEDASLEAREELLNLYNLAVALDPAIIALTRSCPFYEGGWPQLAVRTAHYRGSAEFGWEGVYTDLPKVGGLRPYAGSVEELVEIRKSGHQDWLAALARIGLDENDYAETGGNLFESCWGPVRISGHGTVELRGIDGNYPETTLAVAALVEDAASRVREGLTVTPERGIRGFQVSGDRLLVPDFRLLSRDLFHAAVTEGPEHPAITTYLDSLIEFAANGGSPGYVGKLKPGGSYHTTEASVLREFPASEPLNEEDGFRLVREACDRLEEQVSSLSTAIKNTA